MTFCGTQQRTISQELFKISIHKTTNKMLVHTFCNNINCIEELRRHLEVFYHCASRVHSRLYSAILYLCVDCRVQLPLAVLNYGTCTVQLEHNTNRSQHIDAETKRKWHRTFSNSVFWMIINLHWLKLSPRLLSNIYTTRAGLDVFHCPTAHGK